MYMTTTFSKTKGSIKIHEHMLGDTYNFVVDELRRLAYRLDDDFDAKHYYDPVTREHTVEIGLGERHLDVYFAEDRNMVIVSEIADDGLVARQEKYNLLGHRIADAIIAFILGRPADLVESWIKSIVLGYDEEVEAWVAMPSVTEYIVAESPTPAGAVQNLLLVLETSKDIIYERRQKREMEKQESMWVSIKREGDDIYVRSKNDTGGRLTKLVYRFVNELDGDLTAKITLGPAKGIVELKREPKGVVRELTAEEFIKGVKFQPEYTGSVELVDGRLVARINGEVCNTCADIEGLADVIIRRAKKESKWENLPEEEEEEK